MSKNILNDIIERFECLKGDRATFDTHWQELADYANPGRTFTRVYSPGQRRTRLIYDSTAPVANERLASALTGMLTNPSLHWFQLGTHDPDVNAKSSNKIFFEKSRDVILSMMAAPQSSFYSAIHEGWQDASLFGNMCIYMEEAVFSKGQKGLKFRATPLGNTYIDTDPFDRIDTCFRCWKLTPENAKKQFGDLTSAPKLMDRYAKGSKEPLEFLQAVFPRGDRDYSRNNKDNKKFASYVICKDTREIVHQGGFDEFPFAFGRWTVASDEMYGRGPGVNVLPDIKMCNSISRTLIQVAEKMADPPLMAPDNSFIGPLRTQPGGINYYRPGTEDRIETFYNNARPDVGAEMLEQRREVIRQAYYLDMLDLPMLDRMTATEVMARQQDKQQLLAPIISRLTEEVLSPIIRRCFRVAQRNRMIEPTPDEIKEAGLRIDYVSPLALSQRSSEVTNIERWFMAMTPAFQLDPTIGDIINPQKLAECLKVYNNVPEKIFRTEEEYQARQQQRQEAEAQANAAAMAKDAAAAAKSGAEAQQVAQGL